jgi:hypothetical protein
MCGYRWDELLIDLNGESVDTQTLLNTAIRNIRSLHAVGVTEHFNESVELIFAALGLSCPAAIPKRNALKNLRAENPLFRPIRRKPPTQRLQLALDELVALDERIYEEVLGLFREQCQRHKTSPADQPNMQSPFARAAWVE